MTPWTVASQGCHGIFQARILEWVAISFSKDLPDLGIEPMSPALAGIFFTTESLGKPLSKYKELQISYPISVCF